MCKTAIPKLFQIILNFKESVKINRNLGQMDHGYWIGYRSVVELLTSDAWVPGSICGSAIYFHL